MPNSRTCVVSHWDCRPLSHMKQWPQEMLNGITTRSPGAMCVDLGADLLDDAHRLVAEDVARVDEGARAPRRGAGPSRRCPVEVTRMIASVGCSIDGVGHGVDADVVRAVPGDCLHACLSSFHVGAARAPRRNTATRARRRGMRGARSGRGAMLSLLRRPAFRNLWMAQATSVLGDRLVVVALALFVTDMTGSATDVGLVLGAQTIPLVAFLLIGGVLGRPAAARAAHDRHRRRARASCTACSPLLIFTDLVEVWHIVRDRGAVRHGRGLLPPRLHRPAAAHGARRRRSRRRRRSPTSPTTSPSWPGRRSPPCSSLGRGRRLGVPARRRSRSSSARVPRPRPRGRAARAGRAADRCWPSSPRASATSARVRGCG